MLKKNCIFFMFFIFTLFSCSLKQPIIVQDNNNIKEIKEPIQVKQEGSLWTDNSPLSDMFCDAKARRIGDILTINIVESAKAANNADTKTERKTEVGGQVQNFLGVENMYSDYYKKPFYGVDPFAAIKANMSNNFNGKGTTTRSGNITAAIAVRVTDVLPNGNLKISGSREITVNNEKQVIILSGLVRPRDISPENVVLSTYVSDASISYIGDGVVNEKQRAGWASRIFDLIWPF